MFVSFYPTCIFDCICLSNMQHRTLIDKLEHVKGACLRRWRVNYAHDSKIVHEPWIHIFLFTNLKIQYPTLILNTYCNKLVIFKLWRAVSYNTSVIVSFYPDMPTSNYFASKKV